MATLDGQAAARRLLGYGKYKTGMCLEAVYKAFGQPKSDKPNGSYGKARNVWENTPAAHRHTDRNVPAGAIVLFKNTKTPSAAGHIAISLGGEQIVSTDKPGIGQVGVSSISAIEGSWGGRTYWGWTDRLMGHVITTGAAAPAAGSGLSTADVTWIQQRLNIWGYPVKIDGLYGSQTIAAVRAFQKRLGLTVDGKVGSVQTSPALAKDPAPAAAPAAGGNPTLRKGSTGAAVTKWQSYLKRNYTAYAGKIAVDGNFGDQTVGMTKEWQRRSGIVSDGVVGPQSWGKAGI